jgi:hypothetical protein
MSEGRRNCCSSRDNQAVHLAGEADALDFAGVDARIGEDATQRGE